jgi:hypothetical protein
MGKYISFTPLVRGPIITQAVDYTGAAPSAGTSYNGSTDEMTITTTNSHNLVVGNPILVTCVGGAGGWTSLTGEYFVYATPTATTFTIVPKAGTGLTVGTVTVASANSSIALPTLIDVDNIFRMARISDLILGIYLVGIYDSNKVIRVVFNSADSTGATHNFIMNEIAKCSNNAYLSGLPIYEINSLPGGRTCNFIFTLT